MKSVGSGARPEVSFSCQSLPLLGDWTAPPLPPTHNYSTDYASEQGFLFYISEMGSHFVALTGLKLNR